MRTTRAALLDDLVELIATRQPAGLLRVAVDGPDTAGKTTLADELAERLTGRRPVIRIGVDGFHQPRAVRRRRGSLSPEGFYRDSFDYDAVREQVLRPLGPAGDRRYRTAVFDYRTDRPVHLEPRVAPQDAVLLFDGVFLLRPELRGQWDLTVYVHIGEQEALRRALIRDAEAMGGVDVVRERYRDRYFPGQRLYRAEAAPHEAADIVIDNTDPAHPISATPRPSGEAGRRTR